MNHLVRCPGIDHRRNSNVVTEAESNNWTELMRSLIPPLDGWLADE